MTKAKITPAKREKIEALIRMARISAMVCIHASMPTIAQQLNDLAGVAKRYLEEMKCRQK